MSGTCWRIRPEISSILNTALSTILQPTRPRYARVNQLEPFLTEIHYRTGDDFAVKEFHSNNKSPLRGKSSFVRIVSCMHIAAPETPPRTNAKPRAAIPQDIGTSSTPTTYAPRPCASLALDECIGDALELSAWAPQTATRASATRKAATSTWRRSRLARTSKWHTRCNYFCICKQA